MKRPDWFRVLVILAAGAALIYGLILLGESDLAVFFPSAG